MPNGSEEQKASWKDIARGADKPPSDNSDENASGQANENVNPPNAADKVNPKSTANTKTGSPSPQAKGGKLIGFTQKQQAALLKALENPEVVKALDAAEAAGAFKAFDGEDDHEDDEEDDTPADAPADKMYKRLGSLEKQLSTLTKAFTDYVQANEKTADLQKAGFVQQSAPTGKPGMAQLEKQPTYDSRQAALQKSVQNFEETGTAPDYHELGRIRLTGVLQ